MFGCKDQSCNSWATLHISTEGPSSLFFDEMSRLLPWKVLISVLPEYKPNSLLYPQLVSSAVELLLHNLERDSMLFLRLGRNQMSKTMQPTHYAWPQSQWYWTKNNSHAEKHCPNWKIVTNTSYSYFYSIIPKLSYNHGNKSTVSSAQAPKKPTPPAFIALFENHTSEMFPNNIYVTQLVPALSCFWFDWSIIS